MQISTFTFSVIFCEQLSNQLRLLTNNSMNFSHKKKKINVIDMDFLKLFFQLSLVFFVLYFFAQTPHILSHEFPVFAFFFTNHWASIFIFGSTKKQIHLTLCAISFLFTSSIYKCGAIQVFIWMKKNNSESVGVSVCVCVCLNKLVCMCRMIWIGECSVGNCNVNKIPNITASSIILT